MLGQVPTNDLIENATLINSFPFADNNVRLDLATASGIASSDFCPVGNYEAIYYKFNATNASQFQVTLDDASGGSINQSYVIIFTAPSLNIADETELTRATFCAFTASANIDLVQGTNYYVLIYRNDLDAFSNIAFDETIIGPVPTSERDALVALYNSTNGDSWNDITNWNTTELVGLWNGIQITEVDGVTHVSEIRLGGNGLDGPIPPEIGDFPELTNLLLEANQLSGNIPAEIGDLTKLVELDLAPNAFSGSIPPEIGNLVNLEILWLNNNGLTGSIPATFQNLINLKRLYLMGAIDETNPDTAEWLSSKYSGDFPDLTALPLEVLNIENNFFQFEDIADEYDTYEANIAEFIFNPQFTVDAPVEINSAVGEDITLTLTDVADTGRVNLNSLVGNSYQWFKDDIQIDGANASSYVIISAQNSDSGIYSCEITNSDVPGFVIRRSSITVGVGTLSVDDNNLGAIVNLYPNPTDSVVNIELPESITEASLIMYDLLGKKVYQTQLLNSNTELKIGHLVSGIYLTHIIMDNKIITKRIIKE